MYSSRRSWQAVLTLLVVLGVLVTYIPARAEAQVWQEQPAEDPVPVVSQ